MDGVKGHVWSMTVIGHNMRILKWIPMGHGNNDPGIKSHICNRNKCGVWLFEVNNPDCILQQEFLSIYSCI